LGVLRKIDRKMRGDRGGTAIADDDCFIAALAHVDQQVAGLADQREQLRTRPDMLQQPAEIVVQKALIRGGDRGHVARPILLIQSRCTHNRRYSRPWSSTTAIPRDYRRTRRLIASRADSPSPARSDRTRSGYTCRRARPARPRPKPRTGRRL